MKKFMNSADDFLKESLQGFGAAHKDIVNCYYDPNFITRSSPTKDGKVALISGGGSGHEPMHGGLVGRIKAHFAHSVSAIAPGQSAVFYEGDDVVGGGFIAREKEVPLSHAHKLINKE